MPADRTNATTHFSQGVVSDPMPCAGLFAEVAGAGAVRLGDPVDRSGPSA